MQARSRWALLDASPQTHCDCAAQAFKALLLSLLCRLTVLGASKCSRCSPPGHKCIRAKGLIEVDDRCTAVCLPAFFCKTQSALISSCSEESGCDQDAEDEAVASTKLF